jgi:hypothetical protein
VDSDVTDGEGEHGDATQVLSESPRYPPQPPPSSFSLSLPSLSSLSLPLSLSFIIFIHQHLFHSIFLHFLLLLSLLHPKSWMHALTPTRHLDTHIYRYTSDIPRYLNHKPSPMNIWCHMVAGGEGGILSMARTALKSWRQISGAELTFVPTQVPISPPRCLSFFLAFALSPLHFPPPTIHLKISFQSPSANLLYVFLIFSCFPLPTPSHPHSSPYPFLSTSAAEPNEAGKVT